MVKIKNIMISNALRIITDNFERGFYMSTLMAWTPEYNKEGLPINADPNYRSGSKKIEGVEYFFVRKGWEVRIWDTPKGYMDFMNNDDTYIEKIDLTPSYLKPPKYDKNEYFAVNNLLHYENMKVFKLTGKQTCNCTTAWIKCFESEEDAKQFIEIQKPN